MSPVSQTPAQAAGTPPRKPISFGAAFGLSMLVVLAIVGLSIGPAWRYIGRMVAQAQFHAPDLGLLAPLSLPIKIHLATALGALILGGVLMSVRKGRTFHRVAGWVWVSLVSVTAGATLFITSLNHGRWSLLHLFTGWVLIGLPLAVMWARRHNIRQHRANMMGLFYGGFAINLAFAFIPGRTLWRVFFG